MAAEAIGWYGFLWITPNPGCSYGCGQLAVGYVMAGDFATAVCETCGGKLTREIFAEHGYEVAESLPASSGA
ncbi:hypothetical protein [Frankia sp. AgW1.1]|uniref:hypothetical protein n=1 Tax=Frankia sp. AgW1.1 TaxID=1836971 RepID=UPI0019342983|nr:hypothetical protein [Frankia sp. AgW1.1]MBL7487097.1 hypothetical protein [Frankia sp. AgW1.1]